MNLIQNEMEQKQNVKIEIFGQLFACWILITARNINKDTIIEVSRVTPETSK